MRVLLCTCTYAELGGRCITNILFTINNLRDATASSDHEESEQCALMKLYSKRSSFAQ